MTNAQIHRRLAAILAADVAGYSRMMEADENGTIAAWKAARLNVIDPKIAEHSGRIVKHTGDGFLAEFGSVTDAVNCAIDMQKELTKRSAGVPDEKRMQFRMGINLGDIVEELDDIHGDGVNIAARLESIADPGGICLSGSVYDQVHKLLNLGFEDLGNQKVKNIAEPVRAYKVVPGGAAGKKKPDAALVRTAPALKRWHAVAAAAAVLAVVAGGVALWRPWDGGTAKMSSEAQSVADKPSVAVLHFANMSDDKDQEYFSDGITEDIVTDLSKVAGLFVLARASTARYKGKPADINEVAQDLGVRYVVEGSVRKSGDKVRITAQLIDAQTGSQIWAERYDRELKDVFAIQDDVSTKIVANLAVKMDEGERARFAQARAPKPEAYDLYLRATAKMTTATRENLDAAREMLERAIVIDPDFAAGYSGLALVHSLIATVKSNSPETNTMETASRDESEGPDAGADDLEVAARLSKKAIELGDATAGPYTTLAQFQLRTGRYDDALATLRSAIAVEPGDALVYALFGQFLGYAGRAEEALEPTETALRHGPGDPEVHARAGATYFAATEYEKAIEQLERARKLMGKLDAGYAALLAASYVYAGRDQDARAAIADLMDASPFYSVEAALAAHPYKKKQDSNRLADALKKAGLPVV